MIKLLKRKPSSVVIKVIGIGGAGTNAVNMMISSDIKGAEYVVINTDFQHLKLSKAQTKLLIGKKTTKGNGAGADSIKGRKSALEDYKKIRKIVKGADVVFITAGMGGGTGTGATPVIAEIAKKTSALVMCVVTTPLKSEGKTRIIRAEQGIRDLKATTESLIVVSNDSILKVIDSAASIEDVFKLANDVLYKCVKGIIELVTIPGHINVDIADVRTVMKEKGSVIMTVGVGSGDNKLMDATVQAINNPFINTKGINGAKGLLINITCAQDLKFIELHEVLNEISRQVDIDANIIFGMNIDHKLGDEARVTIIATGIENSNKDMPITEAYHDYKKVEKTSDKKIVKLDYSIERNYNFSNEDLEIPAFLRRSSIEDEECFKNSLNSEIDDVKKNSDLQTKKNSFSLDDEDNNLKKQKKYKDDLIKKFDEIDQIKLWERYNKKHDLEIKEYFMNKYKFLVRIIAGRITNNNDVFNDLMTHGKKALEEAIEIYDPIMDYSFNSFSQLKITKAIFDRCKQIDLTIKGSSIKNKVNRMYDSFMDDEKRMDYIPSSNNDDDLVLKLAGVKLKDFEILIKQLENQLSLSKGITTRNENNREFEFFTFKSLPDIYSSILNTSVIRNYIVEEIKKLEMFEKKVVVLYFFENFNLDEISEILNSDEYTVSQNLEKGKEKIESYKSNLYNFLKIYLSDEKKIEARELYSELIDRKYMKSPQNGDDVKVYLLSNIFDVQEAEIYKPLIDYLKNEYDKQSDLFFEKILGGAE